MAKAKNPTTCRLAIGDQVTRPGSNLRGTLIERRTGGASFGVSWEGRVYPSWYYRDALVLDGPLEPEIYETWFV